MKLKMLIQTAGIEYDDRLRKEVLSLFELGCHIQIVALEYANLSQEKFVYGNVPASTIRLRSRNWFPRGKAVAIKAIEMYWKFFLRTLRQKPEVLWVHNLSMLGIMPVLILLRKIGFVKRLIWDQHELPSDSLLTNRIYMRLYRVLANGCDVVIMANEERRELIQNSGHTQLNIPIEILHNYPDKLFLKLPQTELSQSTLTWLYDDPYVLAQGGANPDRHLRELISAIIQQRNIKLIVVGPYQERQIEELDTEYGDIWREQVLFTGFVPQLEIKPYIDHAIASVVFYTTQNSNCWLCAPNRLYQALALGVPVVVGHNPPMRQLVGRFACGVVVDHNDPLSISQGIQCIMAHREKYHDRALDFSAQVNWEEQHQVIKSIINIL